VAISGDGRRVAFQASPTTPGDEWKHEIWVRDVVGGRTWLASRADGPSGPAANRESEDPALDADGSRVAFMSEASNLGDGDTDTEDDVHVRDIDTGRTFLASRPDGTGTVQADDDSYGADINADGTRVAFISDSTNLVGADTDSKSDVYVRDLTRDATRLVSVTPQGTKSDGYTYGSISIDDAGTRIAFVSDATNLLGLGGPGFKLFVRDLAAETLVLGGREDGASGAPVDDVAPSAQLSPDGGHLVFQSRGNSAARAVDGPGRLLRRDLAGGRTELVRAAAYAMHDPPYPVGVSRDGACVLMWSYDTLLGPHTDFPQVYLRAFAPDCGDPQPPGGGGGDPGGNPGAPAPTATGTAPGSSTRASAAPRDAVAPVVTGARLSRRRFRVARAATALAAAAGRGTTLTFRSSEAATLLLAVERTTKRRGRSVIRRVGTLTRRIGKGAGRIVLSGRLGRRAISRGSYRLVLTARDTAGNRSRSVTLTFAIVKG
jgi:hypothetical protein